MWWRLFAAKGAINECSVTATAGADAESGEGKNLHDGKIDGCPREGNVGSAGGEARQLFPFFQGDSPDAVYPILDVVSMECNG